MGNLNLRGVPDELVRRLKAAAALRGMKMPEFCAMKLEHGLGLFEEADHDNQSGEREREQIRPVQLQGHGKQNSRRCVADPSPIEDDGAVWVDSRGLPQSEDGDRKDRTDQPTPVEVAHTIPEVTVASRLAPKPRTRCPRCEGKVIPWGPDVRCENCNQNFTETV